MNKPDLNRADLRRLLDNIYFANLNLTEAKERKGNAEKAIFEAVNAIAFHGRNHSTLENELHLHGYHDVGHARQELQKLESVV